MRLLVCYIMEYQDDNETGRAYISSESIQEQRQPNDAKVARQYGEACSDLSMSNGNTQFDFPNQNSN